MKTHYLFLLAWLIGIAPLSAQTPFSIVWGMNGTLSGASSSTNFSPDNASLTGAHSHSLPAVLYYSIGPGDYAYGTTYWHNQPSVEKYLSFGFSVNTFEYNLTSVSFRVRRSAIGPPNISLRSSLDGFSSNLTNFRLSSDGVFYTVTVPLGLTNMSSGINFRIYGSDANSYLGVMYFDQIVISGVTTSFVLPISLIRFVAAASDNTVRLDWETISEQNSKMFVVERSNDLVHFEQIGSMDAAGESTRRQLYSFTDEAPLDGVIYYRLKMIDQDGQFNYSVIRDVVRGDVVAHVTVSPNPIEGSQIRLMNVLAKPTNIRLTNLLGRDIPFTVDPSGMFYWDLFPGQSLSSGLYVLSLNFNGRKQAIRVMVP